MHFFERTYLLRLDMNEVINLFKPTGHVMHQQFNIQQLYALPTPYLLGFVFIWEQTATCATYSINWLVFLTEMKSVYSAVRTGSLNTAVCASSFRTNSDLCHLQHKLIGFYKRDEKCLQRGTYWVFKYSNLRFVFKGLIQRIFDWGCKAITATFFLVHLLNWVWEPLEPS